jgi:hypothetical protein
MGTEPIFQRQVEVEVGSAVEVGRNAVHTSHDKKAVHDVHEADAEHDGSVGVFGETLLITMPIAK